VSACLRYLHYDVFTSDPLVGNQLAVFTDARGLETEMMQKLAREMNYAESTFLLPAEQDGTDVRMRIFTPFIEMPIAGHPTIGSTFALYELGLISPGAPRVVFGLNVGPVPVDLEWRDGRLGFAWMTQSRPEFGPVVADRQAVAVALGLAVDDLADWPVQQVSCGVPFLFVPLRDPDTVDRAVPDGAATRKLAAATGLDLPLFIFAPASVSAAPDKAPLTDPRAMDRPPQPGVFAVHSRMFAAEFGITEDPATGIASGPLGCYLVHYGIVAPGTPARVESRQGVAMGRASRIAIAISGTRDEITDVKVGGEAVLVGRGELLLPEMTKSD
jgi:trans-2,3-dihydro-3-hydroxyanthranilate isomerase